MSAPIPLLDLTRQYKTLEPEILPALTALLRTQKFILGPEVDAFEKALATTSAVPEAIGTSSGTDAQLAILMALGIGPGDAIITSPFTFFATAGCLHRLQIEPLFCDIDPVTFNLDPVALQSLLNSLPTGPNGQPLSPRNRNRVRAIIPIHLFGQCADMQPILAIAKSCDLLVIEDAAQALGTHYHTHPAGSLGIASWFSFFPAKNLGAFGDAGAALCHDPDLAARIRSIRNHGMTAQYQHAEVGGNFRLDALQALVLRLKLPHLTAWNDARRVNAAYYDHYWAAHGLDSDITPPSAPIPATSGPNHIYHQYVIRARDRDGLKAHLDHHQIGNAIYYPIPLHLQPCFATLGYRPGDFPVAEQASREVLALPIFPELSAEEREIVARTVADYYRA